MPSKLNACFALAVCATSASGKSAPETPVLNDDDIARINSKDLGWTAGRNHRFEGVTYSDFRSLLGVQDSGVDCPPPSSNKIDGLPDSFDARTKWPGYIGAIRNQGQCGSCWAFAATEVLADRLAIASSGKYNLVLSPEALITCDNHEMGCQGGYPARAANFLVHNGTPSDKCQPYGVGLQASDNGCPDRCIDGSYREVYKYKSWNYSIGEDAMKAALQTGPVAVTMKVYDDFQSYTSGVYTPSGGSYEGLHAVKLLGYGTTGPNDKPASREYWIVANSWGTHWGENGTFRIVRGENSCGIELGASDEGCPLYGVPLIPTPAPTPAPPPPSSFHYGMPPCRSDEVLSFFGPGSLCTPACDGDNAACPTDLPPGTKGAKVQCTNEFNKTQHVCALHCHATPFDESGGCPTGATCGTLGPLLRGFCYYPQMSTIVV